MERSAKTVLVVDDDPDVVDTLRMILERAGYAVVSAPSSEQGLHAYETAAPDVVLVDLMMEEVDAGTSFVKELSLRGNKAPVYMLSSVGDALSRTVDTSSLGLAGVLQKPVDGRTLIVMLQERLGA